MSLGSRPSVVVPDPAAEFLRQQIKRAVHWDCPVLGYDPGSNQMPPGMIWIREDINKSSLTRYRFYNELGEVVTLGDGTATTGTPGVTNVMYLFVASDENADKIENTTTETFFTSKYTLPANDSAAQDIYRVRVRGVWQNGAGGGSAADAEMLLRMYFAGVQVLITEDTNGDGVFLENPMTNAPWCLEVDIGIADADATGAFHAHGRWTVTEKGFPNTLNDELTGEGGSGDSFDGTAAQDIEVSVQLSVADTDLFATIMEMSVERLRVG